MELPFWKTIPLAEMTPEQWESLCDGCGKCCLHKLLDSPEPSISHEPADDPSIGGQGDSSDDPMRAGETLYFTNVTCQLLDRTRGACTDYDDRLATVPECVVLSPSNLEHIHYMPISCAYRRLYEGHDLPSWHPLRHGGDRAPMIAAGMSVVGHSVVSETQCDPEDGVIIRWPLRFVP
ncbi:YcgN family cysteine cluster protein [Aliidiomarina sanyensis]|uniref:YcgN family cysteine cluster protein n=1 Tax=Aliidiomarina sanyensis TaxID=1249555 RepID=A0A432WNF0_9GAMM|nr:YcgN family cysteine cluster protein [Aliidiomarina sanyensis]RUO35330.1 YcgN family cysteine cluster protein [Aliidiomarina sanyensis]